MRIVRHHFDRICLVLGLEAAGSRFNGQSVA